MAILSSMHTHPFLTCKSFQKEWIYGEICLHRSSFSVRMQSVISLRIASLVVRLAISVLEKFLDNANLKASVDRSSVEGDVTVIVSIFGVEGVASTAGAVDGPASSANLTLEGVDCFTCIRNSSSEFDIMRTLLNLLAIRWKLFNLVGNLSVERFKAKSEWGMFTVSIWRLEFELFGSNLLIQLSFSVIAEYSGYRGANSLHNLLLEFGVFETGFISGFRAANST